MRFPRDDDRQEDYQEKIVMQLAEQEEDELERVKEESRRRKLAILEKYKNKPQQHDTPSRDIGKMPVHICCCYLVMLIMVFSKVKSSGNCLLKMIFIIDFYSCV